MTDLGPAPAPANTILIVEDDKIVIRALTLQLQDRGWEVFTTQSADETRQLSKEHPTSIALIDTSVQGLDGVALARSLKAADPDRIVIAMTGYPSLNQLLEGLYEETFDYLVKPFRLEQLDMVIDRARREIALRAEISSLTARVAELEVQLEAARHPPEPPPPEEPEKKTTPGSGVILSEPGAEAIARYTRQVQSAMIPTGARKPSLPAEEDPAGPQSEPPEENLDP